MSRPQALAIARAFLPPHPLGNRYDYYYTQAKLRTDPLYPGVLAELRSTTAPVLDLGCGLGLLAHALRADGQTLGYHGVDVDASKIRRAQHIAQRSALGNTQFAVVDLSVAWPQHSGSVTILDVLQYLQADMQAILLHSVAQMLTQPDTHRKRAIFLSERAARRSPQRSGGPAARLSAARPRSASC